MTTYIRWPKAIDAAFRASYLAQTGEKIQDAPIDENDGFFWAGSSRLTAGQVASLLSLHPTIKTGKTIAETKI